MFKRENRLGKTKDVKMAVSKGRSFYNPLFTLKYLPSRREKRRFTVVVSTKVSKNAVTRNRIKRIIRESIRLSLASFPAGDYVVLVKPAAVQALELNLKQKFETSASEALRRLQT